MNFIRFKKFTKMLEEKNIFFCNLEDKKNVFYKAFGQKKNIYISDITIVQTQ